MQLSLIPHPATPCDTIQCIDVSVGRSGNRLSVDYLVRGRLDDILIPGPAASARKNELWRHTCFEAFARLRGKEGYFEFNFSPSEEWAAYRFDDYRFGMREAEIEPEVIVRTRDGMLEVAAVMRIDAGKGTALKLGLSAVIEEKNGAKSYWALAHPPGKPDFHHPDCFTLELPPPPAP